MGAVNADCAHYANVLIISMLLIFSHILCKRIRDASIYMSKKYRSSFYS